MKLSTTGSLAVAKSSLDKTYTFKAIETVDYRLTSCGQVKFGKDIHF